MVTLLLKITESKLKLVQQRDNVQQTYTGVSENLSELSLSGTRKPKQTSNSKCDNDV
jgi:hypothetical protein